MSFHHREKLDLGKIKILALIYFLFGFSEAIFVYVMSPYLKQISGTENVGIFYFIAYILILAAFLNFHRIIGKWGRLNSFFWLLIVKIISVFFLLLGSNVWSGFFWLGIYVISNALIFVNLDMLLEMYSKDAYSGRIRGRALTALNTGFLVGPLVSTALLDKVGFGGIFIVLIVLTFGIFLIGVRSFKKETIVTRGKERQSVIKIIKKVLKRKDISRIFHISFVLEFFYALVTIYYTLYLLKIGFSWSQIGIILTAALLPFVLFQYLAGHLADKKFGEKEMLLGAVLLLGFFTALIYFLYSQNLWLWCGLMFLARVGASLIEILRDSYFYKRIDERDVDIIDIFRIATPIAYILFAIISAILLLFFPLKIVFLLTAIIVLSAWWPVWRLEDNRASK